MTNELAVEVVQVIADLTGVASHGCTLTLRSGWGGTTDLIGETVIEVPAEKVSGFSANGVAGHHSTLKSTVLESDRVLVLSVRTHFHESRGVDAVAHGVRTVVVTGAKVCILTNGRGSTVPEQGPGTVAPINGHTDLTATSPLRGVSFIDLTSLYSPWLREIARGADSGPPESVYAQFPGPHYETSTGVRTARVLGTDLAGTSTVLEVIVTRAAGMEMLGISFVTDYVAGIAPSVLSHGEILEVGKAAGLRISRPLADIMRIVDRAGSDVARPLADTDRTGTDRTDTERPGDTQSGLSTPGGS